MIRNYFKVAFRTILKSKFYSALNIAGLAIGFAACMLIGMYVYDELSYDKFHHDHANLYMVGLHGKIGGQELHTSNSSPPLSPAMVSSIPGVEEAIRISDRGGLVVKFEDKAFTEKFMLRADSNFFEFFDFKLVEGEPITALKEPNTLVITKAAATRYFGTTSPMGKILTVGNGNVAYTVTGVVEEAPSNSSIRFDFVLSGSSDPNWKNGNWTNNGLYTFIRKTPATTVESINAKLDDLVVEHVGPEVEAGFGVSFSDFKKNGGIYAYYVFPFEHLHLFQSEIMDYGIAPKNDIKYIYILGAVGIIILVIACINFMNLSTARSASRAKEVGLRKTLGSQRSRLIFQFLSESVIYTLAGVVIALVAVYFLIPPFQILSGKQVNFGILLQPVMLVGIVVVFVTVAFLAGSYPAFYLTSFKPVDVLKGKVKAGMKTKGIRSGLVVVQFTISITLIISTIVVYDQLTYLQEKNIGMDKHGVIVLRNTNRLGQNMEAFQQSLEGQAGIVTASYSNNEFPGVNNRTVFRAAGTDQDRLVGTYYSDYNHAKALKLEMVQGEFFTQGKVADSSVCVINEAAAKELGWEGDVIGKRILNSNSEVPYNMTVIGVTKDFNFESFRMKVAPLIIQFGRFHNNMMIRYEGSPAEAIAKVEETWKKTAATEPFEYSFLDQNFEQLFREEELLGRVFTVLTTIAIFVACLGLLGLASFTAEQRTKEIGIRKVMGATVSSVNALLSKEFMILVGISFVLASGLGWYLMTNWLASFAYRIEMGIGVFLIGGSVAALIAWLTVSYHFIKAARSNPADAIRYE